MSEVDDLKNSVKKEFEDCDEFLKRAKTVVDLVPLVQERKREAEAKQAALTGMPEDVIIEYAPKLLPIQLNDQRKLESSLPPLPLVSKEVFMLSSASGTASAFHEVIITAVRYTKPVPTWIQPVRRIFDALAQEKAKKAELPVALEKLQPRLGEAFTIAVESIEKSRSKMLGVDQAAIQLRDVIQQVWGGLAERARQKCSGTVGGQRLELKKQAHRIVVANCLATPPENKTLVVVLDNLFKLADEPSGIGKDPLTSDLPTLETLYTGWFLQIDDLRKLVAL